MADYLIGLATIPAIATVAGLVAALRSFIIYRIQRLNPDDANPRPRAALAARLFAAPRAYVWANRRFAIAFTLGAHWPTQDQAEAVLLDEFAPTRGEPRHG